MKLSDLYPYVNKGLIDIRSDGKHSVACYSRSCFYGDELGNDTWDEVTKNTRGAIFDLDGNQLNHPFPKIFNVNEVNETLLYTVLQRSYSEPFEVLDKVDGHLFILTLYPDEHGKIQKVMSTKGSLPVPGNDLLNQDVELFNKLFPAPLFDYQPMGQPVTLMFEAIVEYDQHPMYAQTAESYGITSHFILLGGYIQHQGNLGGETPWTPFTRADLTVISQHLNCPLIKSYPGMELDYDKLKSLTDVEGVVIHFLDSDFRCKIKTDEYWKLRAVKEFTADKMMKLFVYGTEVGGKYIDGSWAILEAVLPEEIVPAVSEVIIYHMMELVNKITFKYSEWFDFKGPLPEWRKALFTSDMPREYMDILLCFRNDKDPYGNRAIRNAIAKEILSQPTDVIVEAISKFLCQK